MDQKQFDAIKERTKNTTEGPWEMRASFDGDYVVVGENPIPPIATYLFDYDAEFIAHAREDVQALVAEVERLKADRDRWFKRESSLQKEIERLQVIEIETDSKLCEQKKEIEQLQKSITWYDHEHSRLHNIGAETALENERLREALTKIMEAEAPIMEGWETSTYEIARQALGGDAHE